ncbi:ABC-three component system protein [Peribacillus sp. NPDC101481]|uniref:ABC-three component system protein n=1 Tax=Peribacillus sp. NPDC101481 TaxID=3364403 RepID=UPI0038306429
MYSSIRCEDKKSLVLFIHGFTGAEETWINDNGNSFAELLMKEKDIEKNYDFAQIVYYSKLLDFPKVNATKKLVSSIFGVKDTKPVKRNITIPKIGSLVRSAIRYNCESYENIIIVAHSMGGLVAKSVILDELETEMGEKFKLFISLAVPHSGSNFATIAKSLVRNEQILDLNPLSENVSRLQDEWVKFKDKIPKCLYLYGEYDTIVPKTSAVPVNVEGLSVVPCDDDHTSITKPKSLDTISLLAVKSELTKLISNNKISTNMEIKEFDDKGQLEDEIFVLKLLMADVHNVLIYDAKQTFFNAEYMRKALVSQSIHLKELESLYAKIRNLYAIVFGKLLSGEIKSSNELVTMVHEHIRREDIATLKSTLPAISYYQKIGMLHQLANNFEKEIWWAINNRPKDIEDFRLNRDKEIGL